MAKQWLLLAGVFGFLSVALGAFGAHALKNLLDANSRNIYNTAVLYQMFHTLALMGVGLLQATLPQSNYRLAGWSFVAGMVLFCGSLYLLAISGMKWLGAVTPVGGLAFLAGWVAMLHTTARGQTKG